ncbi:MAG: Smr/MutS family protein [Flavobacteriales bacterium]|nr:Smr/MutS family protein [Flavobacteriales bacterium]
MEFKVGQKILFLAESGGGVIQAISEHGKYAVMDEDGFERYYRASQLVAIQGEDYAVDESDISMISNLDNGIVDLKSNAVGSERKRSKSLPEINLHIEELTESHQGLSNYEIISRQMLAFKRFYDISKSRKQRKIIVIHGVGEGVLRHEVRAFLNGENGIEYYDADYTEYGQGATAIEIKYNY